MILRTIAAALLLSFTITGTVGAATNPEANKPSYWGNNCTKTEMGGGVMKFTAPTGTTKVIVKGGTDNKVYDQAPFTDLTAPVNPNNGKTYAISHVIVCSDAFAQSVAPAGGGETQAPAAAPTVASVAAKGGGAQPAVPAEAAPIAAPVAALPETLPEAGANVYGMMMTVIAAMIAGYVAHRRFAVNPTV